jgi:hypothetical protein
MPMEVFCAGEGLGAGAVGAAELLDERGSGGRRRRGGEIVCHWEDAEAGCAMEMGIMVKGGRKGSDQMPIMSLSLSAGADAGLELPESGTRRFESTFGQFGGYISTIKHFLGCIQILWTELF